MHANITPTRSSWFEGRLLTVVASAMAMSGPLARADDAAIDFARDIRPIFADNCFACHGPDDGQRQTDMRLDTRDGAMADLGGYRAIVPGDVEQSALVSRITSADRDQRMPPADSGKQLSAEQIDLIRRWIAAGAAWQEHWAFVAPVRPELPATDDASWRRNAIDAFILARLEREGLHPSLEADRPTLIRRVTLDLAGRPPTLAEVDAFLADHTPQAYAKVVDRLLASPEFGQRMAIDWLDAARYADTSGYQTDGERHMWRWRDWVIGAMNDDLPFDEFTIEQLAGDLLPDATLDQRIATGFNRNHRANSEGGIVFEEYLVEYAVDRVDTTGAVWMGLTIGCARCHDHKYDPISQREYYQLFAYFDNVPERGRVIKYGNSVPVIKAPTPRMQRRLEALDRQVAAAEREFAALDPDLQTAQAAWETSPAASEAADWSPDDGLLAHYAFDGALDDAGPDHHDATLTGGDATFAAGPFGQALQLDGGSYAEAKELPGFSGDDTFTFSAWIRADAPSGAILARMDNDDSRDKGFSLHLAAGKLRLHMGPRWLDDAIQVQSRNPLALGAWHHVAVTYDGTQAATGARLFIDGARQETDVLLDLFTGTFTAAQPLWIGAQGAGGDFVGAVDEVRYYDRALAEKEISILACRETIAHLAAIPADARTAAQAHKLRACFLATAAPASAQAAHRRLNDARAERAAFVESIPTTMVMQEAPGDHETYLLVRGQYDRPGDRVAPGVPAALPPLADDDTNDRLALARWLVDPAHPLTARVAVNRYWQMFFGTGLVRTSEDFGAQGEPPSHPELLDWLAVEFIEGGWDVKALARLIVTSATYRQSSAVNDALLERDPDNRLLARASRLRLPAELVRDQALFAAGLLERSIGGPSVKPYQPAGLWQELASTSYEQDHGERLYRRSMYTFWKRTIPPPAMTMFDAGPRETCVLRRPRTNTPLQALALLNDVTYVEAARRIAGRMLTEGGDDPAARLRFGFRLLTAREPTDDETGILHDSLDRTRARFAADPPAAADLLAVGESPGDAQCDPVELAAYTMIASLILNLDETIMRQ